MDTALLFEAGRVAAARGWQSPDIVPVDQANFLAPSGDHAILISPTVGIAPTGAHAVATLVGAGREVLLFDDTDSSCECAAWLSPGVLHVMGALIDSASPPGADPPTLPDNTGYQWKEPLSPPPEPSTPAPTVVVPNAQCDNCEAPI